MKKKAGTRAKKRYLLPLKQFYILTITRKIKNERTYPMVFMRKAQIRQKERGQKAQRPQAEALGLPQAQAARERPQSRGKNRLEEGRRIALHVPRLSRGARMRRGAGRLPRWAVSRAGRFYFRVFAGRARPCRTAEAGGLAGTLARGNSQLLGGFPARGAAAPFLVA